MLKADCPHCGIVVEPDILGLCPTCTWKLDLDKMAIFKAKLVESFVFDESLVEFICSFVSSGIKDKGECDRALSKWSRIDFVYRNWTSVGYFSKEMALSIEATERALKFLAMGTPSRMPPPELRYPFDNNYIVSKFITVGTIASEVFLERD